MKHPLTSLERLKCPFLVLYLKSFKIKGYTFSSANPPNFGFMLFIVLYSISKQILLKSKVKENRITISSLEQLALSFYSIL